MFVGCEYTGKTRFDVGPKVNATANNFLPKGSKMNPLGDFVQPHVGEIVSSENPVRNQLGFSENPVRNQLGFSENPVRNPVRNQLGFSENPVRKELYSSNKSLLADSILA